MHCPIPANLVMFTHQRVSSFLIPMIQDPTSTRTPQTFHSPSHCRDRRSLPPILTPLLFYRRSRTDTKL